MLHIIFSIVFFIILIIFFIFLSCKCWDFLIKISNTAIEKKIASGKINDDRLAKLCQMYAKPNIPFAFIAGGIFYKKVLKMQKSSYHLYRREVKKRNLFI